MKSFLIAFDLGLPDTHIDHVAAAAYLRTFSQWAKPLQTVWFVKSNLSAGEIRDALKAKTSQDNVILVIEVRNDNWGTSNVSKTVTDWMHANL